MSDLSDAAAALAAVAADHAAAAETTASEAAQRAVKAGELAVLAARVARLAAAFPPPGPDPTLSPVPAGATLVAIGDVAYPLAAVNPARGPGRDYDGGRAADELVAYVAPVEATITNRWGAEVTVVGGKVTGVFDRQVQETGPTRVPAGGLVLSGHGAARRFLLAAAGVGADVVFGIGTTPVPSPGPRPPAQGCIRALWHHGWEGPPVTSWPDDVVRSLTTVPLGMCQSAAAGTGRLTTPPGIDRAGVLHLKAAGVTVLAGVGGSSDGGIAITTSAQAREARDSLLRMRDTLGIDGVDWDLEPSGSTWAADAVLEASRLLIGEGLRVAITSGLYVGSGADWTARWGTVAKALGADLYYWASMNYDFIEASDSRLTAVTAAKLNAMAPYVDELRRVSVFMPRPSAAYTDASPPAVLAAAAAAARKSHPAAGWGLWEDLIDSRQGWGSVRALAKL